MIRYLLHIGLVAVVVFTFFSCEDERYLNSPDAQLQFSSDTITFDTIFTRIGSVTQSLTVYNPYEENVLISRVKLVGGEFSSFRLKIDGIAATEAYEIEVPAKDSIFIQVEVTIDPGGQDLPMVVQDSVEFTINANLQNVKLIAYGQDFKLIKGETIKTVTWTAEKPYLIYDYAFVDSSSTLTIEPGTRIFFHKNSGLYVKGNVNANGTAANPILFLPDRLEEAFKNEPDQWNGIILFSGSHDNVFNHTVIRNANIGLQVGTIENEGYASVRLTNSKIENMAYAGLFALKSKIFASNDVIANCGYYAVALLVGGEYEFYHTTIANYWGGFSRKSRTTSSLVISNVLKISQSDGSDKLYLGDLKNAFFGNSIIYGKNPIEIEIAQNEEKEFNYMFDRCILQLPDTFNTSNKAHFKDVWKGKKFDPKFVDPYKNFNYELDTLSAAKDMGSAEYSKIVPLDLLKKDRTSDAGPDLGAYERIEKKK